MPVDGKPTFDVNGHALTLNDFSPKTADGLSLPRIIISESYLPVRCTQSGKYNLQAKQLDLQTMANFAQRLSLTPAKIKMIDDLASRG